jgi:hypothetical protein
MRFIYGSLETGGGGDARALRDARAPPPPVSRAPEMNLIFPPSHEILYLRSSSFVGQLSPSCLQRITYSSTRQHTQRARSLSGLRFDRRELLTLVAILPLVSASWSARLDRRIFAADACSSGGAFVLTTDPSAWLRPQQDLQWQVLDKWKWGRAERINISGRLAQLD